MRPKRSSAIKGEYGYLFGMIEPLTGKDFMLEMPCLDTASMQVFMDEFSREDVESPHLILVDNASAHTTEKLKVGENIVFIFLPAFRTGTEFDREVLERIKGLAVGLRTTNDETGERSYQSGISKFLGKGNEFNHIV